jgi:hypothetical protein
MNKNLSQSSTFSRLTSGHVDRVRASGDPKSDCRTLEQSHSRDFIVIFESALAPKTRRINHGYPPQVTLRQEACETFATYLLPRQFSFCL